MSMTKGLKRLGDWLDNGEARVIARNSDFTAGDLVMIDLGATDGETVAADLSSIGAADYPLSNAVTPATAGIVTDQWIFGVALEDFVENAEGRVGVIGIFSVDCSAACGEGTNIYPVNGVKEAGVLAGAALGSQPVGVCMDSSAAGELKLCYFNGFGIGSGQAVAGAAIANLAITWSANEPTAGSTPTVADGATVGDDNDAGQVLADITAKLNLMLAAMRLHGLIAP